MGKNVSVEFACNNPDNGLFAGKVSMAQLDGNEIDRGDDVTFTETPKGFRIHRKEFAVISSKEWHGNWCWNQYLMTVKEANRLASHLRDKGWTCTCGDARFYDWMNQVEAADCNPPA